MTRLTEEMVIARTRQSDLSKIKKLNCWGSDLSDVTIVRRMRSVEVLALSVNKINSLADFENCDRLQELYLRKNEIQDLNEIEYLKGLPNLKHLWLEENPCAEKAGPGYRSMVLRALPNLKKLDNIDVTEEEVADAYRDVVKREDEYEDAYESQPQQQTQPAQQQHYRLASPQRETSMHNSPENNLEPSEFVGDPPLTERASIPSSPLQRSPPSQDVYSPQEPNHPTSPRYHNNHRDSYHHQYDDSPVGGYRERVPIAPSMSSHSMKEYYQSDYQKPTPSQYRHSQMDLTEWSEENGQSHGNHNHHQNNNNARRNGGVPGDREVPGSYPYRNGSREEYEDGRRGEPKQRGDGGRFSDTASVVSNAVLNHYASYHRRPVNRSSNLLSATLCLVKELDYPSLEVVEHAVRCRIDELSAD